MLDFVSILKENPNGVFATQDGTKVKTRIFQYLIAEGKKVYFCTNSQKPAYAQLQVNPYVSFCTYAENFEPVLSINGKVIFVKDLALKNRALDENPVIKGIYKSGDNPIFKIFYIDVEELEVYSYTKGPRSYIL